MDEIEMSGPVEPEKADAEGWAAPDEMTGQEPAGGGDSPLPDALELQETPDAGDPPARYADVVGTGTAGTDSAAGSGTAGTDSVPGSESDGRAARLEQQLLEQQLAGLGLNAADLFGLLLGSPLLRQTTALAEEALTARAAKKREEALRGIAALAPELGRPEQLAAAPEYPEMQRILRQNKGMSELDAFKLAFFDRLTRQQAAAGRQGAINAARGRQHLAGVGGQPAGADELTDEEIREYRRYDPSWTVAQIRRFHREYLETTGG